MWRSRTFWRFFLGIGTLLAAALGLLGWFLVGRIENRLLRETRQALEVKARLIREVVVGVEVKNLQARTQDLGAKIQARITLIAADGTVLADSQELPENMENHKRRPEIQQADSEGRLGIAQRTSDTVHQDMMYLARRYDDDPVCYVRVAKSLQAVADEIRWLSRVVWTSVAVTLFVALVLSALISRRLSAPIVELAAAAGAVAKGDYRKRVFVAPGDEVAALAASFNAMSQASAANIAQLEYDRQRLSAILQSMVEGVMVLDADETVRFLNAAAGHLLGTPPESALERKVWQVFRHRQLSDAVERIFATGESQRCELEWSGPGRRVFAMQGASLPGPPLRGAVLVFHDITDLRKLERVRQDFVANVSHELKTPLSVITAAVETLLDGALSDPEHGVRFLERIRENATRLNRLVQDLLTLGRIESAREVFEIRPLPLQGAVAESMARHAEPAQAKGLRLETGPPDQPVAAMADAEALADILDNLIDNAIKYTPAGGQIHVRWSAQDGEAVIEVADTGVGIPQKDLSRVFERFYRVDRARSRELGGTGLGLSIVKHLALALHGAVSAESQLDVGSKFTVRLPLAT